MTYLLSINGFGEDVRGVGLHELVEGGAQQEGEWLQLQLRRHLMQPQLRTEHRTSIIGV